MSQAITWNPESWNPETHEGEPTGWQRAMSHGRKHRYPRRSHTMHFRNLTALPDEQFYRLNAESCLREAERRRASANSENDIAIVKFYEERAAQYLEDLGKPTHEQPR